MATETQQQNQQSRSHIETARSAASGAVPSVLLASFLGAFLFSVKVQGGLFSLDVGAAFGALMADPAGTVGIAVVVWVFVGIPAAGGVFLANN